MNVLYISSYCTGNRNKEIQSISKNLNFNFQAQKFHSLLVDGFRKNKCDINCLSTCSILSRNIKNKMLKKNLVETIDGIKFYSLNVIFFPFIQQIHSVFSTYFFLRSWFKEKDTGIIICDTLEAFYSLGVIIYCKSHRKKCVAVVTDLPSDSVGKNSGNLIKKIISKLYAYFFDYIINWYSGHILLTNNMSDIVNKKHKKNIVMEGLVELEKDSCLSIDKYEKRVVLFAGSIEERFGIKLLLDAFSETTNTGYELHLYGQGSDEQIIQHYLHDSRIKFFGVVPNEKILIEERKAWLLINPRLTSYDYVKYSFPSKNMEYMNSGTCVLTTCLPSMPSEYYPYVYTIDEESPEHLKEVIENILNKDNDELIKKGQVAKQFVQSRKNNYIQAKRVIEMCGKL